MRALVLGGGGVTGAAWELGLLAGLAERGVDLTGADLVVGTSAGSVVGAEVATGVDIEERYAKQLLPPNGDVAAGNRGRSPLRRRRRALAGQRRPRRRVRAGDRDRADHQGLRADGRRPVAARRAAETVGGGARQPRRRGVARDRPQRARPRSA